MSETKHAKLFEGQAQVSRDVQPEVDADGFPTAFAKFLGLEIADNPIEKQIVQFDSATVYYDSSDEGVCPSPSPRKPLAGIVNPRSKARKKAILALRSKSGKSKRKRGKPKTMKGKRAGGAGAPDKKGKRAAGAMKGKRVVGTESIHKGIRTPDKKGKRAAGASKVS